MKAPPVGSGRSDHPLSLVEFAANSLDTKRYVLLLFLHEKPVEDRQTDVADGI